MNLSGKTVVFFGNGPVAAASLQGFIDNFGPEAIEAVVTKARAPHHKDPAPVELLASTLELTLWFANNKTELETLVAEKSPNSCVGIIIDYGVVVSRRTINSFEKGIINSHFSLLPEWRGADPITYSLLSGQAKTGVSIMLIDEGLDTGPLLAHADYNLSGTETNDELTAGLIELSNHALKQILPLYLNNEVFASEQQDVPITYSRKLLKSDGILSWGKTAPELEREIRAYTGWPKSSCALGGLTVNITKAKVSFTRLPVGKLQITDNKTLLIGCRQNSLEILDLQPQGKTAMPITAFLNGYSNKLG